MSESYKPPCTAKATTEDYIALVSENARLIAAVNESEKRWSQEFRMRENAERELVLSEDARVFASNGWKAAERELAEMTARVEKMESGVCADCLILERARGYQRELAVVQRAKSCFGGMPILKAIQRAEKDIESDAWMRIDRARAEQGEPAPVQSNSFTYDGGGERSCRPVEKGAERAE